VFLKHIFLPRDMEGGLRIEPFLVT